MKGRLHKIHLVIIADMLIVSLLTMVSCSGSKSSSDDTNMPGDEETPQAITGWEDRVFGENYFEEIDKKTILQIPSSQPEREALYKRGKYLVSYAAACGACHGAKQGQLGSQLSGGFVIKDSDGLVRAPNITSDKVTGIGDWSIDEIIKAVRTSIGRDGKPISSELHEGYRWIADKDALAIAIYLKATSPIKNEIVKRESELLSIKAPEITSKRSEIEGYVPMPPQSVSTEYGRYLAMHVSGCARCHKSSSGWFSDSKPFEGEDIEKPATVEENYPLPGPDIRGKTGALQSWTVDDYIHYLSSGQRPNGTKSDGKFCPWPFYQGMTNEDKKAISLLLKKL